MPRRKTREAWIQGAGPRAVEGTHYTQIMYINNGPAHQLIQWQS